MDVLAIDLGASSGRAIVGQKKNGQTILHEVHRFSNGPVTINGTMHWDIHKLLNEIYTGIKKSFEAGYHPISLAVDSWGVDYGLIDDRGQLVDQPVHYRDQRSYDGQQILLKKYQEKTLKKRTYMASSFYNTVNQLLAEKHLDRSNLTLLNMPDLINYFLTGKMNSEYSMATTTQLYDYHQMTWHDQLIGELALTNLRLLEPKACCHVIGNLKPALINDLQVPEMKVISITSHDTAVALRTLEEDNVLFIATGTWIIVGVTCDEMLMNETILNGPMSYEGGLYPKKNLLINQMGLWLIQESKRYWQEQNMPYSFSELVKAGKEADIDSIIDVSDERFAAPGDMPEKIKAYCEETQQPVPDTVGEVICVIACSLAKKIAEHIDMLEVAIGQTYDTVHMYGGGIQDQLLIEMIKKYTNKSIELGVVEATAYGNVLEQFITLEKENQ